MRVPRGESLFDPKSVYFIFREELSAPGFNKMLRAIFKDVGDPRDAKQLAISLVDALMSAFAMFVLKVPSLLQFDGLRQDTATKANLNNLFGIENIPSDTSMREILDRVDPNDLRGAFTQVFSKLQRGKALEDYVFMNGFYLLAIDGTGYFSSKSVYCQNCLEKHARDSDCITYHHQMLGAVLIHPDQKVVIPLCPEPIVKQDGGQKNDCERNACRRILEWIDKEHPRLKLIITEDGLASNAPHIRDIKARGMSFILGAKPGDHKYLFEEFDLAGNRTKQVVVRDDKKSVHILRYVNGLQLNEKSDDTIVNFLDYAECRADGKELHFSWVTDIEINDDNAFKIMRGGRARWKIENETFNTLKNQGYEFEHNYGHGYKNLSIVMPLLMMLAFLIDQAQLLCCNVVQSALANKKTLSALYRSIRTIFTEYVLNSWADLYSAIAYGYHSTLILNRPGAFKHRSNSS